MEDEEEDAGVFEWLPLDCLLCICDFLSPRELCMFGATCKAVYEASLLGYLWRHHSMARWVFCNVLQVPEGPRRWRRYFLARRKMDASLDRGRPTRDYKVKTMRGHKSNIKSVVVVEGRAIDWENPGPPLVVTLSEDKSVKAWDVLQGVPVWSLDEQVSSVSADSASGELATGGVDGIVTIWDSDGWKAKCTLSINPNRDPVEFVRYGRAKSSNLPASFLMVLRVLEDSEEQLGIWDTPSSPVATSLGLPLVTLKAPNHDAAAMQLCRTMLAVPGKMGDIDIWDLSAVPIPSAPGQAPPTLPHLTICTSFNQLPCWVGPGLLATGSGHLPANLELWDVSECFAKPDQPRENTRVYRSQRTIQCLAPPICLSASNGLIVVGESNGSIQLFDARLKGGVEGCLQTFSDHKGPITDLYVDNFRVVSCSKDFSLRVYRWNKTQVGPAKATSPSSSSSSEAKKEDGTGVELESRYTLLGGSVAHKTHDGFSKVLCAAGSCMGVAGNQLKFYNFSCALEETS